MGNKRRPGPTACNFRRSGEKPRGGQEKYYDEQEGREEGEGELGDFNCEGRRPEEIIRYRKNRMQ